MFDSMAEKIWAFVRSYKLILNCKNYCCYLTSSHTAPKETLSPRKQVSLVLVLLGSFLSQQAFLAFTIQQTLIVKALRRGFLTKLQLAQSSPADKRFELLLLFIIHMSGSRSPIRQALLTLRNQQPRVHLLLAGAWLKGKASERGPGAEVCSHLPLWLAFTNISACIACCPLSVNPVPHAKYVNIITPVLQRGTAACPRLKGKGECEGPELRFQPSLRLDFTVFTLLSCYTLQRIAAIIFFNYLFFGK